MTSEIPVKDKQQQIINIDVATKATIDVLSERRSTDPSELVLAACVSLNRGIALEFATFCSSWYPDCSDDIDVTARPRWEAEMLKVASVDESVERPVELGIDQRTVERIEWIRQYVRWTPGVIVAEAVGRLDRYAGGVEH